MDCLDADSVTAVLNGSLDAHTRASIDEHLDVCDACRRLVAAAARDHVQRDTIERPASEGAAPTTQPATSHPQAAARHVMLAPGATVDRYVVRDFLGAGAMGAVYAARDPKLDREIALKVVGTASDQRANRLVREAQAMARVSHPNVVPVYDAGTDERVVFIAMKKVDGARLPAYVAKTAMTRGELLSLLCGAGRGLAAAHAAGIVHRDFKPDNVLVDNAGTAQVADFGLAAIGESEGATSDDRGDAFRTADGTIVGTPAYLAPEVRRGQRADAASDQYAFALTVSEALGDEAPRRVRKALDRARAEDPKDRYPSMTALVSKLEHRSLALPIGVAVIVIAAGIFAWPRKGDPAAACDNEARAALAQTFGDEQRAAITAHGKTLSPVLARDLDRALAGVDRYTSEWVAMRESSCRATIVTGEQPSDVDELRARCLDARLDEVAVVAKALTTLDAAHAAGVADITSVLGDLEQCADAKALRAVDKAGPEEPRELRRRLAEAHLAMEQGYFDQAEPQLDAIVEAAKASKLPAVEAEATLSKATLVARTGRKGASEGFRDALSIAERIGDSSLRVDAQIALLAEATGDRARRSEAELLAKLVADGIEALPGTQTKRRALSQGNLAVLYEDKGDFAAAEKAAHLAIDGFREVAGPTHPYTLAARDQLAHIEVSKGDIPKAVAVAYDVVTDITKALGPDAPELVKAELTYGTYLAFWGKTDDAAKAFQRSHDLAVRAYGPDHPKVGEALRKLAYLELSRKHHAEAADAFTRAIAIQTKAAKRTDDPKLVPLLVGLGQVQIELGDAPAAKATLERAFAIWGDSQRDAHLRPQAGFALARALWDTGGDKTKARELATEAHAQFLANKGPWLPLAHEVEQWLTTHR